jgi:hypothetical protein
MVVVIIIIIIIKKKKNYQAFKLIVEKVFSFRSVLLKNLVTIELGTIKS